MASMSFDKASSALMCSPVESAFPATPLTDTDRQCIGLHVALSDSTRHGK
jgi:hypothetical protein